MVDEGGRLADWELLPYETAPGEGKLTDVGDGSDRPGGDGNWRPGAGGGFMMEALRLGPSVDEFREGYSF